MVRKIVGGGRKLRYLKFIFWQIINLPLFNRFTDLVFPVTLSVVLTLICDYSLRKILPSHYSPFFTLFSSIVIFFIILYLQHRVIEGVFRRPLREFISSLRYKHPVTKRFGVRILSSFVGGRFRADLFSKINNLSELLTRIELRNGYNLPVELYAVLLDEAASLKPTRLWATWDFSIAPIGEVFTDSGEIKPNYQFYFRTLTSIYLGIKQEDDKIRIFIFENNEMKQTCMNHKGWDKLLELHKKWGFKTIHCILKQTFRGIQISFPNAYMEDFVYFELKWLRNKWVIGMDGDSRIASLACTSTYVDATRDFLNELRKKADTIILYRIGGEQDGSVDNQI